MAFVGKTVPRTVFSSSPFRNLTADQRDDITRCHDAFVGPYGMDVRRNNRGEAHANGAVESRNRHLKTAIRQALIRRGSRDFACVEDYRRFVDRLVARRGRQRADAVLAGRAHLKPLPQRRTVEPKVRLRRNRLHRDRGPVTRTGGFLVKSIFYSAPSQLIGHNSCQSGPAGPPLR